jgi:hypothetical protein
LPHAALTKWGITTGQRFVVGFFRTSFKNIDPERNIMAAIIEALPCPACGASLQPEIPRCGYCGTLYEIHSELRNVKIEKVGLIEADQYKKISIPENGEQQHIKTVMLKRNNFKLAKFNKQDFNWTTYQDTQGNIFITIRSALHLFNWVHGKDHGDKAGAFVTQDILVQKNTLSENPLDYVFDLHRLCALGKVFVLVFPIPDCNSVFDPELNYYYENLEKQKLHYSGKLGHRKPIWDYESCDCYLAPITFIRENGKEKITEKLTFSYLGYPGSDPDGWRISERLGALIRETPVPAIS